MSKATTLATLLTTLGLAACGSSGGSASHSSTAASVPGTSSGGAASSASAATPTSGCGSFAAPAPQDPNGVLQTLPAAQRASLDGVPAVAQSAWSNWKPQSQSGWKVDAVVVPPINQFQASFNDDLQHAIKADKRFSSIRILTPSDPIDVSEQTQLFATALRDKPTVIVLQPIVAPAFTGLVNSAGKAGIPVVVFDGDVPSADAVNVANNDYLYTAKALSTIAREIHGKGRVLFVHGFVGSEPDVNALAATKAVLKNCPDMSLEGTVVGNFQAPLAKGAVLQFLATHPEPLGMISQAGGMAAGIIQAFQSSGRTVPPVADVGALQGSLAYWLSHRPQYQSAGYTNSGSDFAAGTFAVMLRMLLGEGVKVNYIAPQPPLVTDANLKQITMASAPLTDATLANYPGGLLPDAYLNPFFKKGHTPTDGG